jgi:urease accessory protein
MRRPATRTATTTTSRATVTDAALVRLLTWLSPAFPTGAFAYSHGLEWAVEAGDVQDEAGVRAWVADALAHGAGRSDAILLRAAYRASDDTALADIAALAGAVAPSRERQAEARGQGTAFAAAAAVWGSASPIADLPYAVAVGAYARRHAICEHAACLAFLQAFAANLVSAAVRLVPLGQTAGLRVVAALEPVVLDMARGTRNASLDDLGGACFRSDLASIRHETQYTRLFRS